MVLGSDSVEVANLKTCNSGVRSRTRLFDFAISAAVSSSRKYASVCSAACLVGVSGDLILSCACCRLCFATSIADQNASRTSVIALVPDARRN